MSKAKSKNSSYTLEMLKALIIGLIISLIAVLILALFIVLFNLNQKTCDIIIQVIKGASILLSLLISFKLPKNGWLRGVAFGILYIMLTFIVFSLLDDRTFGFNLKLLNDVALGAVSGLISGIIAVNLRKGNG